MRKKLILILAFVLALSTVLIGCSREEEIYVITNRFFAQQLRRIQVNHNDYIGRTVQYDGMFMSSVCNVTGDAFYFIGQFADDCCGGAAGGPEGFEVYLGSITPVEDFTWVQVIGVLEEYHIPGLNDSILRVNIRTMVEIGIPGR